MKKMQRNIITNKRKKRLRPSEAIIFFINQEIFNNDHIKLQKIQFGSE